MPDQPAPMRDELLKLEYKGVSAHPDERISIKWSELVELRALAERAEPDEFSLLSLLADIRKAAGDPAGKLMQDELVARIAELKAQPERAGGVADGWVLVPRELTAENGAKYKFIGEKFGGHAVPWAAVKEVHKAVVAWAQSLNAAPQPVAQPPSPGVVKNCSPSKELLRDLVHALETCFISSWQSTAAWQKQLNAARDYLNTTPEGGSDA